MCHRELDRPQLGGFSVLGVREYRKIVAVVKEPTNQPAIGLLAAREGLPNALQFDHSLVASRTSGLGL
jgi:hypothetical protein